MQRLSFGLAIVVILFGGVVFFFRPSHPTLAPTKNANTISATNLNTVAPLSTLLFSTADLPDRDPAFEFSIQVLPSWRAEYNKKAKAINLYEATDGSTFDDARLWITPATSAEVKKSAFAAGRLSTELIGQTTATVYQLRLDQGTTLPANANEPAFLRADHRLVMIEDAKSSPARFYAVAVAPTVDPGTLTLILRSFQTE